jgi:hypothetical protein
MPENRADDTVDHTKPLPEDQPVDDDASLGGEPETAASAAHVPTAVRDADMTNAHVGAGELGDATFSGEHPTVGKEGQTSGKEDARDAEKDDEDEQHISHNHNSDPDQCSIRTTRLAEAAEQHSSWIAEGEAFREPDLQEQAAADTQMQDLGYDKTERMHTELDRGEKDVPDDLPPPQESERETPGETHLSHDAHTNAEEQSDEHEDTSDLMAVTPLSDDKEPSWIANAQTGADLFARDPAIMKVQIPLIPHHPLLLMHQQRPYGLSRWTQSLLSQTKRRIALINAERVQIIGQRLGTLICQQV